MGAKEATEMTNETKKRILVVDDEVSLCSILKLKLEQKGFDVAVAYSGEECLEALKDSVPDVIILDLILPKLSGYEVCAKIKIDHASKVPVIIHTALADTVNENLSKMCKADAYVPKPHSSQELEKAIQKVTA